MVLIGLTASTGLADYGLSYLTIDGVTYRDVKFGPANQGKVLIRHGKGVAFIPIEKIPPQLGPYIFGYDKEMAARGNAPTNEPAPKITPAPKPIEPVAKPTPRPEPVVSTDPPVPSQPLPKIPALERLERQSYDREKTRYAVVDGKLVEKTKLTPLVGFLVQVGVEFSAKDTTTRGSVLALAQKKADAATTSSVFDLRPGLWERTGEKVALIGCSPADLAGMLVRVYGTEAGTIDEQRAYHAGMEPTFEQWKQLRKK